MKKLLFTLLLFIAASPVYAVTHISTATVSGNWTLAGSPYIIHNNISVASAAVLTIDPGVQVAFAGYYKFNVEGVLNAAGTSALPIVFHSLDTTGWAGSDTLGGWYGLEIGHYWGTSTLVSTITHCRFQDMRGYGLGVFFRNTAIRNTEFTHNTGRVLQCGFADTTYTLGLYNCSFHHNETPGDMTSLNFGALIIHGCQVYNNTSGGSTLSIQGCKIFIDSNEIHDNLQTGLSLETTVNIMQSCGYIKANKIHHNTSQYAGALAIMIGRVEISGNFICNNRTIVGFTGSSACGSVEGGGGVRISGEGGTEPSFFLVRNNVIANNYAALAGGGIYVMLTDAVISNNTLVNNKGFWGGGIYIFNDASAHPHTRVNVKNNIFKNNVTTESGTFGLPNVLIAMWIATADTVLFERNVSEHHFADNYFLGGGATLVPDGDTASNFATVNPGMVAPTLTASYLEDATSSNFKLLITSPAINRGSVPHAMPDAIDHTGSTRILGAAIDVGAYEFGGLCATALTGPSILCAGTSGTFTYPTGGGIWSSYDAPGTITLGTTGTVTAIDWGFAVVNYIVGGCLASAVVNIDTLQDAGTLSSAAACFGTPLAISASVAGGTWSCAGAASVTGGIITGLPVGTATVSYTVSNYCGSDVATLPITVNPLPAAIGGDTLACLSGGINITWASNDSTGGRWSSSDETTVTIDTTTGELAGHAIGTATITYTLPTGCYVTSNITVIPCPDAVNDVTPGSTFKVYPNPVSNQLVIESDAATQRLRVFDIQGKCVYESMLNDKYARVDMSQYKAGIYFVCLGTRPPVQVVKK